MGIGGHCPFNLFLNNFDIAQQCPPYDYLFPLLSSLFPVPCSLFPKIQKLCTS
ncbi:hypothetical protein BJP36_41780 [Moorena producens JHB]|uniref:Uncharacterized protein n=1 Tax=Moorena producens (strain JHB) TaxID=1454205 RepID=A0A9Q9SSN2_MOOP1|nr:hypothetical protein [Moorena producens]WAN68897.1 hypothetical protein BJP36_41780 [Moorena producens JHB]